MLKNEFKLLYDDFKKKVEQVGKKDPSFLLLHGYGDTLVPYSQMETFYEALQTADTEVKSVYVDGGEHEGNFWGSEVRAMIHKELVERLGMNP